MPLKTESHDQFLEDQLQELIFKHGLNHVQAILNQNTTQPIHSPTTSSLDGSLKDGHDLYTNSDHFFLLADTSQKTYSSDINHFEGYALKHFNVTDLASIPLNEVLRPQYLKVYIDQFNNTSTKSRKSAFLRSYIQTIALDYFRDKRIALQKTLKVKRKNTSAPKAFNKVQLAELMALSKMGPNGHRNHAILWVLFSSGIRVSSLVNLKIGDINFKTQSLRIIAKGHDEDEEITAKINKLGLKILREFIDFFYEYAQFDLPKEEFNNLYVFSNNGGMSPLSTRTIELVVKNLVLKAKSIPEYIKKAKRKKKGWTHHYGPHAFRHSFSVYALESGIDIYTISKLLNHASIASTENYLNLLDHQLQNAIEKHKFAKKDFLELRKEIEGW
jgi:integrase/recombinase XerD